MAPSPTRPPSAARTSRLSSRRPVLLSPASSSAPSLSPTWHTLLYVHLLHLAMFRFENKVTLTPVQEMNGVYEKWFSHKPARSCVAVKTLPKNVDVEIEAIALV